MNKKEEFKLFGEKLTPYEFLKIVAMEDVSIHFSEAGEDATVLKLFNKHTNGFYVDIGAFRPQKYSNTFILHRFFGWKGINIDASEEAISIFNKERPNDKNIQIAIGQEDGQSTFYKFKEKTINTISEENVKRQIDRGKVIVGEETVQVMSLETVFSHYVGENQVIDLLNVDIEGEDLRALKSNNWEKYRPRVILVEDYSLQSTGIEKSEIYRFLHSVGYTFYSHTYQTSIYVSEEFKKNSYSVNSPNLKELQFNKLTDERNLNRASKLVKSHPDWQKLSAELEELKLEVKLLKENNEQYKKELNKERSIIGNYVGESKNDKERILSYRRELSKVKAALAEAIELREELEKKYNILLNSRTWKYLSPLRNAADIVKIQLGLKNKKQNKNKQNPKDSKQLKAQVLEKKLWGGFSTYALADLQKIIENSGASKKEKYKAAWSIMRWEFAHENYKEALEKLKIINKIDEENKEAIDRVIMIVKCLVKLNQIDEAKKMVEDSLKKNGPNPDLCLAMANFSQSDDEKLTWINKVFQEYESAPILKKDKSKPLTLDNIAAKTKESMKDEYQPFKISVIIPAYNAEEMISITIESLIAQTWKNLEVVIVDDFSSDNTCKIVEDYAKKDSRIKLIRKEKNEGAYAARNTALQYITGDYVTIHDSDDWSHPEKLERQITALRNTENCTTVVSYWARVHEDMTFVGPWFPKGTYFERNLSSLLFHRDVIKEIGGWDEVRVTGDTEFLWRIQSVYGKKSVLTYEETLPLSFSLSSDTSLTRSKATHVRTVKYGLRRVYREAAKWWHNTNKDRGLYLDPIERKRTFPAPVIMSHSRPKLREYDLVFITDFSVEDEDFKVTYNNILAAIKLGKKVGLVHYGTYNINQDEPISSKIYNIAQENQIDILVPGEEVNVDLVIVGNPHILHYRIDNTAKLNCNKFIVLVGNIENQPEGLNASIAKRHLKEIFDHEGKWIPISASVFEKVEDDEMASLLDKNIWYPIVETEKFVSQPIRWRRKDNEPPIIGRISEENFGEWPTKRNVLEKIYGVEQGCTVKILGNAKTAIKTMGGTPDNWKLVNGNMSEKEFFSSIDFYVYYNNESVDEDFNFSVALAMAVGIPVILPPKYERIFGIAALYGEPEEVMNIINEYWQSEFKYKEQARIGREFIIENCSSMVFGRRIEQITHQTQLNHNK